MHLCPYCFNRFKTGQIVFRCANPVASCAPEPDLILAAYEEKTPEPRPRVFSATATGNPLVRLGLRMPQKGMCKCGYETWKKTCPRCHNDWPSLYEQTDSLTIAFVGAKSSGKSHYIAVLIHQLMNSVGARFNAALNAVDDRTRQRYTTEFRHYIYDNRVTIPPTLPKKNAPLIYRITFPGALKWFPRVVSLVFFDTAGENLDNLDVIRVDNRYLAEADAVLMLLDPLQIPSVRDHVPDHLLPEQHTHPQDIVERVIQIMREQRGISPRMQIPVPVALTFSKIDAVRPLFDRSAPLHRGSPHSGFLDLTDVEAVSDCVRTHVSQWMGSGLDQTIQKAFSQYGYFGVSALGRPPDAAGNLGDGVAPHRVEDPFLWLLYELKVIHGRETA